MVPIAICPVQDRGLEINRSLSRRRVRAPGQSPAKVADHLIVDKASVLLRLVGSRETLNCRGGAAWDR